MAALSAYAGTELRKVISAGFTAADEKGDGTLRLVDTAFVSDKLNANNPLMAYTSGIQIADVSAGAVTIKYNETLNGFVDKDTYGEGPIKGVKVKTQIVPWNTPQYITEAMTAYDIKKGAVNVLSERLADNGIRFLQKSIKAAFDDIKGTPTAAGALTTAEDKLKAMINAATEKMNKLQYPREAFTLTIESKLFNELAMLGLMGDRMTQSFAGGQFSISTLMGFRVQSGEMFLPSGVDFVVGVNDAIVWNTDVLAANVEKIGMSNDMGTYCELADVYAKSGKIIFDEKGAVVSESLIESFVFA